MSDTDIIYHWYLNLEVNHPSAYAVWLFEEPVEVVKLIPRSDVRCWAYFKTKGMFQCTQ